MVRVALIGYGYAGRPFHAPLIRTTPGLDRQFYVGIRDAVQGAGPNPVPPKQALPVMAVLEVAIRSSVEGRALELPLTEEEIRGFGA